MSLQYVLMAWDKKGISPLDRVVLLAIADNTQDRDGCELSPLAIMRYAKIRRSQVDKAIASLVGKRIIESNFHPSIPDDRIVTFVTRTSGGF